MKDHIVKVSGGTAGRRANIQAKVSFEAATKIMLILMEQGELIPYPKRDERGHFVRSRAHDARNDGSNSKEATDAKHSQ